MLAGAPGAGKSVVALNWAWRTEEPVLYVAQDSPRSVLQRMTALATKTPISRADGPLPAELKPNLVVTTGAHTVALIESEIVALTEWWQRPPSIIFIDNLIDMRSDRGQHMDVAFYADILPALKQAAIKHDVAIVALHHVQRFAGRAVGSGETPLTMTDLLFGGEREARHVWGVYRSNDRKTIYLQVLKQQDGQARSDGTLKAEMVWQPEYGRIL